jgi:penicillin-binding protein 2
MAAVGNGGTLYRPQLVEKIAAPTARWLYIQRRGARQAPVKPENLKVIQEALRQVTVNPRGTAVNTFSSLGIYVAGKTGTAESDAAKPHAWFAAYTDHQRAGKPDIAVAVIAEYAGEGADIAAPIARRVIEVYFLGRPVRHYPWEAKIYVTRTPAPTDTPSP